MKLAGLARMGASTREVRIAAEWQLLLALIQRNSGRLIDRCWRDATFLVTLRETLGYDPTLLESDKSISVVSARREALIHEHRMHITFPRHYPAVPMEVYLARPIFHPNIHPQTGFVCLWQRHSLTHTVEHAVHKTAAILGWRLFATDPAHVMQLEALTLCSDSQQLCALQSHLAAPELLGVEQADSYSAPPSGMVRRRLS